MDPWTTLDRSSRSSRRHAKMPTRPTCRHENSTRRRAKSPNGQVADSEVKPLKSFIVEVCLVCSTTRRPSSSASSLFASATWYVGEMSMKRHRLVQHGPTAAVQKNILLLGAEMTMDQRVTGHGSSGSTNLSGSRGSVLVTR